MPTELFKMGNRMWRQADFTKNGLKLRKFKTPEDLWEKCCEYFKWCEENPLYTTEVFGKDARKMEIPKMRAFTRSAMYVFIGISMDSWVNYCKHELFKDVCEVINHIIFAQKFEGASSGMFNANIMIRDLGLIDKKEIESNQTSRVMLYAPDNNRKIKPPKPIELPPLDESSIEDADWNQEEQS